MLHDLLVVGAGLLGSATARHLAAAGRQVLLVGPTEDDDPATARAFASHYDRARIVRQLGHDAWWTGVNRRAVAGMEQLAAHTGRPLRTTEGCLYTSLHPDDPHIRRALHEAAHTGLPAERLQPHEVYERWPDLAVPCRDALYEAAPSGTVDPRQLVSAQLDVLGEHGGQRLDALVHEVRADGSGFVVATDTGELRARTVVVAAGASTHLQPLLPTAVPFAAETETIVLVGTTEACARRMEHVPALLDEGTGPGWDGLYAIRPLPYADGVPTLKLGCNLASDRPLHTLAEVRAWMAAGDSEADLPQLLQLARQRYPTLEVRSARTHRCFIVRTPDKHPRIAEEAPGWWVVAGGNGYGAMASDGLGQIAAEKILHTL
jgi:sarcosine oxidase